MAYVFDGVNKIITFDSPTYSLSIVDLWSRYVDWLSIDDNNKFLLAMRTVGGDALPEDRQLGITYFISNGWKIRPFEESHTLTVVGNLYTDDGSSPFTQVLGNYNVMIVNTVSNLMDTSISKTAFSEAVSDTIGPQIEFASFENKISIDVENGLPGIIYPAGSVLQPVNNLLDALLISEERGIKKLYLLSDLAIGPNEDISDLTIVSDNWFNLTLDDDCICEETIFERLSIYGRVSGNWNVFNDCWLYNITNFCGWMRDGSFSEISLAPYNDYSLGQSYFDNIKPMYPNEASILNFNTNTVVSFISASDLYQFNNMTAGCLVRIGLIGGGFIIDSSCTGGTAVGEGTGALIDNSNGLVEIIDIGLLNEHTTGNAVWDSILAEHQLAGSAGKSLSTASSGGVDIQALVDGVWNEPIASHLQDSSFGKEFTNISANVKTALDIQAGNWEIANNQMIFYDLNNVEIFRYNLFDSNGSPSVSEVFKRVIV